MFFYTYVLLSLKDNKFYIGVTKDLQQRVQKHYRGEVIATKHRRPFRMVYYEACLSKIDAIKREKYFKMGFGRRFLKNRLENYFKKA